jgi:hypothetical protein
MTGDQLCNAALRKLSVLGDGQSPSATQLTNATEALNVMLKTFMADGMPLWVISEYNIPLTATHDYTIGVGQTINIPAPLKVTQVILKDLTAQTSIPLNIRSHYDYNLLANQGSVGTPTTYFYEPKNQIGVMHIWPIPDAYAIANQVATMVYQRPFYDMTTGTDTLDFPQYWQEAIIYGLAWRLSPEYGVPLQDRNELKVEAEYFLQKAQSFGTEEGSFFIQPDWVTQ